MTGSRYCSLPECAALRVPSKKPWFAVIGRVPKAKFGMDEGGVVEVINLKDEPKIVSDRVDGKNAFPAYHMNKENWITVLLDGTVDEKQIMSLLDMSYELAGQSGSGKRLRTEPKDWLIPAAPAMYDVEQDFRRDGTIIWKQTSNMIAGDTVYIYMAAPISAVMYRCEAVEVNIPYNYDDGKYRIKKAVKLRLVHRYSEDDMPLAKMKDFGVSAVRGARGVPNTLACELKRLCGK